MLACALTVAGAWLPGLHFLGEAPGTENSAVMRHADEGLTEKIMNKQIKGVYVLVTCFEYFEYFTPE